ncbi:hypothetical protein Cni_G01850 [Canna indica]|uniref:Uncharacterized protein n=1 Tax=Canna indica TaxID=4628 RepID=A0AAQ3Q258_9LILI|nr:hypothetical protein Cni_G01850 [Canna indica]
MLGYDLSKKTVIFELHPWVLVGICVGVTFILFLFLISLWITYKRSTTSSSWKHIISKISKEIQEVQAGSVFSLSTEAEPSPLTTKH